MESDLDLNDYLVQNPSATFCVKAIGDSMKDAGISSGDIMVVDKSLEPKNRSIVLAIIDGEFTVKRVNINSNKLYLVPENNDFSPIEITEKWILRFGVSLLMLFIKQYSCAGFE